MKDERELDYHAYSDNADKLPVKGWSRPTWSISEGELKLSVWKTRWPKPDLPPNVDDWLAIDAFSDRSISFVIKSADHRLVASGSLMEWRANRSSDPEQPLADYVKWFEVAANDHSARVYEAAFVIARAWPDEHIDEPPFRYGNVLIFDRLRIDAATAAESGTAWALIGRVIKRSRPLSVMVLKAFPLEYEGKLGDGATPNAFAAFAWRQAAMLRLYAKRLGVRPFPGESGEDGWIWRPISYPHQYAPRAGRPWKPGEKR